MIEEQIDKWGPLRFIIVVDPKTGKVKNAAMMKYVDSRARPLSHRAYLKTFMGKGMGDPMVIGKDVNGISGATISAQDLAHMMKKVSAAYSIAYLGK